MWIVGGVLIVVYVYRQLNLAMHHRVDSGQGKMGIMKGAEMVASLAFLGERGGSGLEAEVFEGDRALA